jgi:hypothetical protein
MGYFIWVDGENVEVTDREPENNGPDRQHHLVCKVSTGEWFTVGSHEAADKLAARFDLELLNAVDS